MKKTKLTRSLMAAVSIVALSAVMYGCVHSGDEPPAMDDTPDLTPAQDAADTAAMAASAASTAADMAAMAAETAATAAEAAADAQTANMAADAASYGVARNAATRARAAATDARTAATAAMTASAAAAAAKASADDAETLAAAEAAAAAAATAQTNAEAAQKMAEGSQATAMSERDNAVKYAGMVQAEQDAIDAEIKRMADVASAKTAAMTSYMDADADATKADTQATDAEAAAPGSPGAVTAREAATAARTAATAAKAAHDAITDDMTKAQADAQAAEAAKQAMYANAGYKTAMAENDDIQTTGSQIAENNRQNAVTAARKYGGQAADNAMTSASDARTAANAAKTAANDAMAEYMRAKSARTNSTKAKEASDDAHAAYMAANTAANDAHAAYMAAKAAVDGVMDDTSLEDANTARDTAEAQEGIAAGHRTTAMMKQTDAESAEMMAMTYADMHVVGLLMMANGRHITTVLDPNAQADELAVIERNRLAHVANVNRAVRDANYDNPTNSAATPTATAPWHGGGTVTASWHYYGDLGADNVISDAAALASDAANADSKPGEGKPMISVTPEGGGVADLALIHAGPGADETAGTDDDVSANFTQGPGLGVFSHEKYFGRYNDTNTNDEVDTGDTNQRVILFTDLTQAKASVDAITAAAKDLPVTKERIMTWSGTEGGDRYDHDGDSKTAALPGDFSCGSPDPNSCAVVVQGGKVQSISGYVFTSTGFDDGMEHEIAAAKLSTLDDTWLAFGVWLTETVAEGLDTYAFGAFADGGAAIGDTGEPTAVASVTGDATYNGKAAGVHSTATEVEFFHGDVTLTAKFGAIDTDAERNATPPADTSLGTITGMIHNIMSGGRPVSEDIELLVADPGGDSTEPNIVDAGTFGGQTRMGPVTGEDDAGEDVYSMTGGWSGTFYNHMADNAATTTVRENERAPGSVAGTFGVGRADNMATTMVDETESYVGAFGAHCSGATNCNPHD